MVVIRYEGPKGGPGMQEMLAPTTAIKGVGLDDKCGPGHRRPLLRRHRRRLRSATSAPRRPSAARSACSQDGDIIDIDIPNGVLSVRLTDEELADRRAAWTPRQPKVTSGYLARYARMATSADTGAILKWD